MGRYVLTVLLGVVICLASGCSSIIDDFVQLPGDGPATDVQSTDTEPDASFAEDAGAVEP